MSDKRMVVSDRSAGKSHGKAIDSDAFSQVSDVITTLGNEYIKFASATFSKFGDLTFDLSEPTWPIVVDNHIIDYDEVRGQMYCEDCNKSPPIPASIYDEDEFDEAAEAVWQLYAFGYFKQTECIGKP